VLAREEESPREVFDNETAETTEEDSDREARELVKFRRAIALDMYPPPRASLLSYETSAFELASEEDVSSAPASDPK
jgi:hypothetical protein